jgi:hypothetical protein
MCRSHAATIPAKMVGLETFGYRAMEIFVIPFGSRDTALFL